MEKFPLGAGRGPCSLRPSARGAAGITPIGAASLQIPRERRGEDAAGIHPHQPCITDYPEPLGPPGAGGAAGGARPGQGCRRGPDSLLPVPPSQPNGALGERDGRVGSPTMEKRGGKPQVPAGLQERDVLQDHT